ncbi:MAG: hypothetical protein FJX45_17350 [Alphaproteobacteria bacterium]|nr:hypothetical protein [Alphaproteobacteria bacterium]
MLTFRAIIDAFTISRLAKLWGLPESHVRTMRARDSIPPEYWPDLFKDPPESIKAVLNSEALKAARRKRFNRQGRNDPIDGVSPSPFPEAAQ